VTEKREQATWAEELEEGRREKLRLLHGIETIVFEHVVWSWNGPVECLVCGGKRKGAVMHKPGCVILKLARLAWPRSPPGRAMTR
jgi:hypothetical protein